MTLRTIEEVMADLVCVMCARVGATVQGPEGQRAPITPIRPEHAATVRQLRCPYCRGRLWLGEARYVRVLLPLTAEEINLKRGRPLVSLTTCDICKVEPRLKQRRLCGECDAQQREARQPSLCSACKLVPPAPHHTRCGACRYRQSLRSVGAGR